MNSVLRWVRSRRQPVVAVLVIVALAWSVGSSLSIYPHSLSYFNELAAVLPTPADASYPTPKKGTAPICSQNPAGRSGKWGLSPFSAVWAAIKSWPTAGPRNGPRHLLDSNIDWGQDLFYLKDWLDEHPETKLDGLAYWGSYPAALAGIPETPQPPMGPPGKEGGQSHFLGEKADLQHDGSYAAKIGTVPGAELGPKPGWYALSVNYIYSRNRQYRYFLHFEPAAMAGYSIYIYHITLEEANRVRRGLGMEELARESYTFFHVSRPPRLNTAQTPGGRKIIFSGNSYAQAIAGQVVASPPPRKPENLPLAC